MTLTRKNPSTINHTGAVNPNNALTSNDQYAQLNDDADELRGSGYSHTTTDAITQVNIGIEAVRDADGVPKVRVEYKISGTPGATSKEFLVNGVEGDYVVDVTNDREWTDADIANLEVIAHGVSTKGPKKTLNVDHVFCEVRDEDDSLLGDREFGQFTLNGATKDFFSLGPGTHSVTIKALEENTGKVYIGEAGTTVDETNGHPLMPGEEYKTTMAGATFGTGLAGMAPGGSQRVAVSRQSR